MVVTGEDSGEVPDTAEMLQNFHIATGFCAVGKADSSLIVEPSVLANYGITQACISRMILNHIMDFIECVVKDTHNDIHTKRLEIEYPYIITEDLNDHVMRDETAYGVEETFFDDEEDPSRYLIFVISDLYCFNLTFLASLKNLLLLTKI
jgi:hypothetical protein